MEYEEIKGDGSIEWDFRLYDSIRNSMRKIDYERELDSRRREETRCAQENSRSEKGRKDPCKTLKKG